MSYVVLSIEHQRDEDGDWVARLRIAEEHGGECSPRYWTLVRNDELGWFVSDCDQLHTDDDVSAVAMWADASNEVAELFARIERTKP